MKRRDLTNYLAVAIYLGKGVVDAQHLETAFSQGCFDAACWDPMLELTPLFSSG